MDHHRRRHRVFTTIAISFFFVLINFPESLCDEYSDCSRPYNCGILTNIYYPFWDNDHNRPEYCGGGGGPFKLYCDENHYTWTEMGLSSQAQHFLVYNISTSNYIMTIEREELHAYGYDAPEHSYCSPNLANNSLDRNFSYTKNVHNITMFYCPPGVSTNNAGSFPCLDPTNGEDRAFYVDDVDLPKVLQQLKGCKRRIQVQYLHRDPLDPGGGIEALNDALSGGFEVNYTAAVADAQKCKQCADSKGACGVNPTDHQFTCYRPSTLNWPRKIIIGVASGVFGALVVSIACYIWYRRKKNSYAMSYMQSRSLSSDPSLKDTEKGSLTIAPGVHLFSYTELEEATNYFDASRELGEGGFGTVYFGKLPDGRCVAVKRLYENNYRRVEQFMNEIMILARLVHPNLVTLYGCTSRHGRELLLVYEYIPNGTVADHLHGERTKPGTLPWHIRMNIAVETASALKYLHVSDIIHRDVKTNNILLDSHFRVKVADFGLSRLFPNDVTHISTAPQGTPGYVDPEYHECYQLTSKSDVYSFGVVLIELISSLPAVDITRHRHEINLAHMAINKIHNQALHELVDPTLGFESDEKVRKMINAVAELGFQCLQSSKDMRPSMEEVLDTLKDIQSGGKRKSQPEVMDISSSPADDVVLLKDDPPPPSPDSNAVSKSTTPNASG